MYMNIVGIEVLIFSLSLLSYILIFDVLFFDRIDWIYFNWEFLWDIRFLNIYLDIN